MSTEVAQSAKKRRGGKGGEDEGEVGGGVVVVERRQRARKCKTLAQEELENNGIIGKSAKETIKNCASFLKVAQRLAADLAASTKKAQDDLAAFESFVLNLQAAQTFDVPVNQVLKQPRDEVKLPKKPTASKNAAESDSSEVEDSDNYKTPPVPKITTFTKSVKKSVPSKPEKTKTPKKTPAPKVTKAKMSKTVSDEESDSSVSSEGEESDEGIPLAKGRALVPKKVANTKLLVSKKGIQFGVEMDKNKGNTSTLNQPLKRQACKRQRDDSKSEMQPAAPKKSKAHPKATEEEVEKATGTGAEEDVGKAPETEVGKATGTGAEEDVGKAPETEVEKDPVSETGKEPPKEPAKGSEEEPVKEPGVEPTKEPEGKKKSEEVKEQEDAEDESEDDSDGENEYMPPPLPEKLLKNAV